MHKTVKPLINDPIARCITGYLVNNVSSNIKGVSICTVSWLRDLKSKSFSLNGLKQKPKQIRINALDDVTHNCNDLENTSNKYFVKDVFEMKLRSLVYKYILFLKYIYL